MSSARDPQGDSASHHDRQLDLRSYFRGVCHSRFRPWRSYAGLLGGEGRVVSLFGLTDPNFDDMGTWDQFVDLLHHTALPLLCYVVGGFAWLTMMMKNNLMDNLAADYVRTAVAKGVSFRSAVFKHAFRNSFIPIASTLGQLITILVSGSILIESVFDIQGFGLLQYQALLGRDQTVIMGTLTIAAFLLVLGNILSDLIVAMVDPRVKFN